MRATRSRPTRTRRLGRAGASGYLSRLGGSAARPLESSRLVLRRFCADDFDEYLRAILRDEWSASRVLAQGSAPAGPDK
jgi:hypothetical protein